MSSCANFAHQDKDFVPRPAKTAPHVIVEDFGGGPHMHEIYKLNQRLVRSPPVRPEAESSGAIIIEFDPWNRTATAALQQELFRLLDTCERMADYLGYEEAVHRLAQTRNIISARRRAS